MKKTAKEKVLSKVTLKYDRVPKATRWQKELAEGGVYATGLTEGVDRSEVCYMHSSPSKI